MSRSRRKPVRTQHQDSPGIKRVSKRKAAKAVRKRDDISDGANYKKAYDSWNICDWKFFDNDHKDKRTGRK